MGKNEYVEIFYPSYYSDKTYGAYVLYRYYKPGVKEGDAPDDKTIIKAGVEHKLEGDEILYIYYKAEDGKIVKRQHKAPEVIQPSFDLYLIQISTADEYEKEGMVYNQLGSNETISTRVLLQTKFNTTQFVYWIVNNPGGVLFEATESQRILGEGEFFVYTDSNKEYLTILGRGTKLNRQKVGSAWTITAADENKITQSQLSEAGLAAKIPFVPINFGDNNLTITEMETVTLGEGDKFWFKVYSKGKLYI